MRKAGVLLPISSLPSPWGIGALGAAAREFIDFLAAAGQSFWQILPLGPTSYGDSPYQSFSSWAGNPYFIDLDDLAAEGLLERQEYQRLNWGEDPARVDYGLLYKTRYPVLRKACARLLERGDARFHSFCLGEADWLEDYALFMALKERFDGRSWQEWPQPIRLREPAALEAARTQLAGEVNFWKGVQYLFCPSTPPWTAPTCGPVRSSFSWMTGAAPPKWPGVPRTPFLRTASSGATPCLTGNG